MHALARMKQEKKLWAIWVQQAGGMDTRRDRGALRPLPALEPVDRVTASQPVAYTDDEVAAYLARTEAAPRPARKSSAKFDTSRLYG